MLLPAASAASATARKLEEGKYEVKVKLVAKKMRAEGLADAEAHVLNGAAVHVEVLRLRPAPGQRKVGLPARIVIDEYRRPSHLNDVHRAPVAQRHDLMRRRPGTPRPSCFRPPVAAGLKTLPTATDE